MSTRRMENPGPPFGGLGLVCYRLLLTQKANGRPSFRRIMRPLRQWRTVMVKMRRNPGRGRYERIPGMAFDPCGLLRAARYPIYLSEVSQAGFGHGSERVRPTPVWRTKLGGWWSCDDFLPAALFSCFSSLHLALRGHHLRDACEERRDARWVPSRNLTHADAHADLELENTFGMLERG